MSLYNLINGINPAAFFFLPMLGKHPDEYPRFRDCFIQESELQPDDEGIPVIVVKEIPKEPIICVYTRTGGGNRESYNEEIEKIRKIEGFIKDYDDDFDSTFMTFVFKVPERFLKDYDLILTGKITDTSKEYKEQVLKVYPKIAKEIEKLFTEGCNNAKK